MMGDAVIVVRGCPRQRCATHAAPCEPTWRRRCVLGAACSRARQTAAIAAITTAVALVAVIGGGRAVEVLVERAIAV